MAHPRFRKMRPIDVRVRQGQANIRSIASLVVIVPASIAANAAAWEAKHACTCWVSAASFGVSSDSGSPPERMTSRMPGSAARAMAVPLSPPRPRTLPKRHSPSRRVRKEALDDWNIMGT